MSDLTNEQIEELERMANARTKDWLFPPVRRATMKSLLSSLASARREHDQAVAAGEVLLAGQAEVIEEMRRESADLRSEIARLTEALRPFAAFKFGARWAGHVALERDGDTNVLFGYGDDGQPTGVNVDYSDFERARAALSSSQNATGGK